MTVHPKIGDEFPTGLRVLAVDDNPTCLMVLESLLRKCQYHVTTANQAITALNLLRENKDKFDLVISDVDMPDMDGFMLLEHVGLEMDIPVIMLSSYGDKELVMKGITHGACDYLLKPVRIQELKIIWQHVVRRKQLDYKEWRTSDKVPWESGELREEIKLMKNVDHNVKSNRKRKDQTNDQEKEYEEKGQRREDLSTQKKRRIVWTQQLHQKFTEAVDKLGLDKAVPKKILELMNDVKLTRENVASHLQKYRLHLKKSFGYADSAYAQVFNEVTRQNISMDSGYTSYPGTSRVPISPSSAALSSSGIIEWGGEPDTLMNTNINHEHNNNTHSNSSMQTGNQGLHGMLLMPLEEHFFNAPREGEVFGNGSSKSTAAISSSLTSEFSSMLPNFGRSNDNWPAAAVHSPSFFHEPAAPSSYLSVDTSSAHAAVINPHQVSPPISSVANNSNTSPIVKTYLDCPRPSHDDAGHNMNHHILHQEFFDQSKSNHTFCLGDPLLVPRE